MNLQQGVNPCANQAAPAGYQVVAFHCVVSTVVAAGYIVESGIVVGSDSNMVESGIQEPESGFSLRNFLLIGHCQQTSPLGSSKAGASIPSAASPVITAVLVGVCFCGDIRIISQGG